MPRPALVKIRQIQQLVLPTRIRAPRGNTAQPSRQFPEMRPGIPHPIAVGGDVPLYPARLIGDSAYGSAEMLNWLVR
jgi:hypothetical protein